MLTYEKLTKSEAIRTYISRADESLAALGYTEHSFAHVGYVANTAVTDILPVPHPRSRRMPSFISHIERSLQK